MTEPAGPQTRDFITWFFTALALIWNGYNFWYARKLRRDTFDLDEWKLERGEIQSVIREFEGEVDLLISLSNGAHPADELRSQLTDTNQKIAVAHRKIVREVERSNVLKLPPSLAYGASADQESAWDRVNEALAEVAVEDDAERVRKRLKHIAADARSITAGIDRALTAQRDARRT